MFFLLYLSLSLEKENKNAPYHILLRDTDTVKHKNNLHCGGSERRRERADGNRERMERLKEKLERERENGKVMERNAIIMM